MSHDAIPTPVTVLPFQLAGPLGHILREGGGGRVTVGHGDFGRHLWFEGGRIVAVTSDRDEEKLGSWLVTRGVVPPGSMHEALAGQAPGERLGQRLLARSLVTADRLLLELEARSLALLWRSILSGGTVTTDEASRAPADTFTVEAEPQRLLVAAARVAEDLEPVAALTGDSNGWVCPDPESTSNDVPYLEQSERYVLTLLKRPRTLDGLRRAALVDYPDLLRSVAALAAAGLVVPCRIVSAPPPVRAAGDEAAGTAPADAAPVAQEWVPLVPAAEKPRIRDVLDALDAAEMAADPVVGSAATRVVSRADYRRAKALLDSATELAATGVDSRQIRPMLLRAYHAYPGLRVMLRLAEIELPEENLRTLALDRLQKVLAQLPRCTEAWLLLARYWELRGQPEKVRACGLKVLAYDPSNPAALEVAAPPAPQ